MSSRLRVDWPQCHGRGLCHELLPEVVSLDEWGYPVIETEVPDVLLGAARSAVRGCPRLAIRLVESPGT